MAAPSARRVPHVGSSRGSRWGPSKKEHERETHVHHDPLLPGNLGCLADRSCDRSSAEDDDFLRIERDGDLVYFQTGPYG